MIQAILQFMVCVLRGIIAIQAKDTDFDNPSERQPAARTGTGLERGLQMDFEQTVFTRRSVRRYMNREVPEGMVHQLLRAGLAAPSGGNLQPWHFFVVRGQALKEKLCECFSFSWPREASCFLIVCAQASRSAQKYGERGASLYCIQDTAAAVENILLCAHAMGLGSCWIGSFDEALCSKVLKLGSDLRPVAILPVGFPAEEPEERPRRPLAEVVTFLDE